MKSTISKSKVVAGTGIHAEFKPSPAKRQIRFATTEQVREAGKGIDKEFEGAFKILAK